jgi:cell division protease FtsH
MVFLGKELGHERNYSEATQQKIDAEVRRLVEDAHHGALVILRENEDKLHTLALALLEREILDAVEIDLLLSGQELEPMEPAGGAPTGDPPDAGPTPEEKPSLPRGYPTPDPHPGPA